jgi:hypothetical protein
MKKQILILALLVVAMFAGTKSYAQKEIDYLSTAPTYCVPAVPLTCGSGTSLTPSPGVEYTYTINDDPTVSTGSILWFVTDDVNIMTAEGTLTADIDPGNATGDYLLTSDAAYNSGTNTSESVTLSWKSFDGATNTVLLVAYAKGEDGCSDNIDVYRIEPTYAFTLDIAGLLDGGTEGAEECVSPVQTATYDGSTDELTVDYGANYVYFTVNAANWQTSWETDFAAVAGGTSTITSYQWAYPDEAATTGTWRASGTAVEASHYTNGESVDGFVDEDGACIVIRVEVEHGTVTESIADEIITLTINGEMINAQTSAYDGAYPDLDEPASGTTCAGDVDDTATYTITARPDIDASDPTPFETKTPDNE